MKKTPIRKCMGCNEQKEKSALIRIIHTPEGEFCVDTTGKKNGRGAYICKNAQCLAKIQKSHRLDKIFDKKIPDEIYDALKKELDSYE